MLNNSESKPDLSDQEQSAIAPAQPAPPDVLIVDDNQILALGLSRLFRSEGFSSITFHAGLPAISFVRFSKPRAAVIDIHLPDINGLVLSKRLREEMGPDAPIVVLSGDGSMEVLNSLPHVGATYFFCKPVNPSLLLQHVRDRIT